MRSLFLAIVALLAAHPAAAQPAAAQPAGLQAAARQFRDGAFADAEETYQTLLAAEEGLDRTTLEAVYRALTMVRRALQDDAGVERALTALLSLDPDAVLEDAPPSLGRVVERLREEIRAPVGVEVHGEVQRGEARVTVRATEDVASLVRSVRLYVREDEGWRARTGDTHRLAPDTQYFAEAVGPGGAVLASEGSTTDPRMADPAPAGAEDPGVVAEDPSNDPDTADEGRSVWRWLGPVLGVLLVGAAVSLTLVLRDPSQTTRPTGPMPVP